MGTRVLGVDAVKGTALPSKKKVGSCTSGLGEGALAAMFDHVSGSPEYWPKRPHDQSPAPQTSSSMPCRVTVTEVGLLRYRAPATYEPFPSGLTAKVSPLDADLCQPSLQDE